MSTKTLQCDSCAFLLREDQSTIEAAERVEAKYRAIREAEGAPRKPRRIHVGGDDDKTETCFIDSPTWPRRNEDIYCPDRIDSTLSLEIALDLRNAGSALARADDANALAEDANRLAMDANRIARDAKIWAIIAAIIAAIAIIAPYVISTSR
jgi:hypothetical protein